ncbi:MAG: hypothetical protein PUH21_02640 [Prevotellaceae bacterium]|nr:hypothetical protein [Prevotellaceae bacterium]
MPLAVVPSSDVTRTASTTDLSMWNTRISRCRLSLVREETETVAAGRGAV